MSAWAEKLENPVSARLRDPRTQSQLDPRRKIIRAIAEPHDLFMKIERHNAQVRHVKPLARLFQPRAQSHRQPRSHFVRPLPLLSQQIHRPPKSPPCRQFMHPPRRITQPVANQARQTVAQFGNVFVEFAPRLHH